MEKYVFGDPSADTVLIQPVGDHDIEGINKEAEAIEKACGRQFRLIGIKVEDWNRDLSPWSAPAVFGKEGFGSGAADTLGRILELCADRGKKYYIGGYSLAGLFALWAVYQTDVFCGAAAASPSVWFPGFTDYMIEHSILTDAVYLSLGKKEEKTQNKVMAAVGDKIREIHSLLQERSVSCVLEWNEGDHFRDADLRTARAFAWLMNR